MFRRRSTAFCLLLLTVLTVAMVGDASLSAVRPQGHPGGLFIDLPASAAQIRSDDPSRMRARLVSLNLTALSDARGGDPLVGANTTLLLNLFDDASYSAVLDRIDPAAEGFTWVGHIPGIALSTVTLATLNGILSGSVAMPEAVYAIRYVRAGVHEVSQVDQSAFLSELNPIPVSVPEDERIPLADQLTTGGDDGSQIDLMVLFTPAAAAAAGGTSAMTTLINLGVSESNTSYANSGISQRLRLVHSDLVTHSENNDLAQDLYALSNYNGSVFSTELGNTAASLRNTHGADLVTLITAPAKPNGCGIAWLMTSVGSGFAPYGFNVVERSCISPNYTFAHELGHNMGARHDWFVDNQTTPQTYAHGYVNTANRWRTIMAYNNLCPAVLGSGNNCTRLLYWSNPGVNYNTVPMGIPGGTKSSCPQGDPTNTSCDADDQRTLNDTAFTVANFRQAIAPVAPTAPVVILNPSNGTVSSGTTTTFTSAASGSPAPTVTWQVSTNSGSTWTGLAETSPYSGVTSTTLTLTNVPVSLNGSLYRAIFTNILDTATSTWATLSVTQVTVTPTALRFAATKAGASGGLTAVTAAQTVTVNVTGASTGWTAGANQPWLQLINASGSGAGLLTVGIINTGNVLGGATNVSATITITPTTAGLSTTLVGVTLTIDQTGGATMPPFGVVDAPTQDSTGVVGAIGITGWALDDVGVSSVKLYRNCLAFEPAANCQVVGGVNVVYMGDATMVDGARPDVEAAYPTYPQASRAGWGYLLLTIMLPHIPTEQMFGGQGRVSIYAFATDVEGHLRLLGRSPGDQTPTTITMANDTIAKPFGAIDTPGQGQAVSGTVANFGWALTPDSNKVAGAGDILVPTTGASMWVWVDGAPLSIVTYYNLCRGTVGSPVPAGLYCDDDVANTFGHPTPQPIFTPRTENATKYRNLDAGHGAIAAYFLDTTALSNGVHTIVWGVTDSAGRAEGIGSRYFTVLNTGASFDSRSPMTALAQDRDASGAMPRLDGTPAPAGLSQANVEDRPAKETLAALLAAPAEPRGDASWLEGLAAATGVVVGRTGFDVEAPVATVPADETGVRYVQVAELGRLELWVGTVDTGYLVADGTLRDLPPGSHLDPASGLFTWMPGLGYFGTYRLTFVRGGEQMLVDVTIRPVAAAAPSEAEIRMHVDQPQTGQTLSGAFTVAGWALDPQAPFGSGVDAVHVWAQDRDVAGAEAQFLGAAALGGARPDVGTAFGAQFGSAGFSLTTAALGPGKYDVTAYVWNRRSGRWEDARTVSITVR